MTNEIREPNTVEIKDIIGKHQMRNLITTNFAHSVAPELMVLQTDMKKGDCKKLAIKFQSVLKSMYNDTSVDVTTKLIKFRKTVETSSGNSAIKTIAIGKIDKALEDVKDAYF